MKIEFRFRYVETAGHVYIFRNFYVDEKPVPATVFWYAHADLLKDAPEIVLADTTSMYFSEPGKTRKARVENERKRRLEVKNWLMRHGFEVIENEKYGEVIGIKEVQG